jgi:protein SCO1/2
MKALCAMALSFLAAGVCLAAVPRAAWQPHRGAHLPLELKFRDERGQVVGLDQYFDGRPVVLVLGYVGCRGLCSQVWQGAREALRELPAHRAGVVLGVSIDPRERPGANTAPDATRSNPAWPAHRLTDWHGSAARLARAVGFEYEYRADIDQYAHPAGLVVVSGSGRICDYLPGVRFDAARLESLLGSPGTEPAPTRDAIAPALLLCFHYDPATGRYSLAITRILTWLCLALVGVGAAWWWRERGRV